MTKPKPQDKYKEFDSSDYGDATHIHLCVGSHHVVVIDKLYGPTCVDNLKIVWEGQDWNVRNKRKQLIEMGRASMLQDVLEKIDKWSYNKYPEELSIDELKALLKEKQ